MVLACDIAEFIKKFNSKINRDTFNKWVQKFQISEVISYALLRLKEIYAGDFPSLDFEMRTNPIAVYLYKRNIFSRILSYLVFFSMQETLGQKFKFVLKTLFPPDYVMAHNFNISSREVGIKHYITRMIKSTKRMF
jgi:hypothetical protein